MKEIVIGTVLGYFAVGVFWVLMNHNSTLAKMDRARWKKDREYWKFVWAPTLVVLIWPLALWCVIKIRRMAKTGELQQIIQQVKRDHMKKEHGMPIPPVPPHFHKHKTPPDIRFHCPRCGGSAFGSSYEGDPQDPNTVMMRSCHGNDAGDSTRQTCPFRFPSTDDWKYFTVNGRKLDAEAYKEFFDNLPPAVGVSDPTWRG